MSALLAMFGMQAAQGSVQGLLQRKEMQRQNEAIAKANLANINAAQETILAVDIRKSFVRQQAQSDMESARRAALAASGEATAEAAAAGVRGASIDAVQSDISRALGENIDQQRADAIAEEFNLNAEIQNIAANTRMNLTPLHRVPSVSSTLLRATVGAGVQAGATYTASRFQFGTNSTTPAATSNRVNSFKSSLNN